ncbi:MAG: carbonic anhydrase [Tenacibaculum sp.]|nr:carbonic anhydrase [Tenacibaculum sp.]
MIMNKAIKILVFTGLVFSLVACKKEKQEEKVKVVRHVVEDHVAPDDRVLTKEDQARLTPDGVIQSFVEGNRRFMRNDLTKRDHSAQIRKTTYGQYPKAVILSCIDSRVPVEDIFDKGIGDIFVTRIAGNISDEDVLGSLEYSCKVAGSKLVLVLGHENCGAVKSAIKYPKNIEGLGNINDLLSKIRPVVESVNKTFKGEKSYKNKQYLHEVCTQNVKNTKKLIRERSAILREMEEKGEIKIIGAIYDLHDGKVDFFDKK